MTPVKTFIISQRGHNPPVQNHWAREIAHWLKALAATLPEDPGSTPSTHVAAYSCLELQFQGSSVLFWPLWGLGMEMAYTDIHPSKIPMRKK